VFEDDNTYDEDAIAPDQFRGLDQRRWGRRHTSLSKVSVGSRTLACQRATFRQNAVTTLSIASERRSVSMLTDFPCVSARAKRACETLLGDSQSRTGANEA